MKKLLFPRGFLILLSLAVAGEAFAVWAPASLNEGADNTPSGQVRQAAEKVRQDERLLAEVLARLEEDEKELRKSVETSSVPGGGK